jgi:hypothetical protein
MSETVRVDDFLLLIFLSMLLDHAVAAVVAVAVVGTAEEHGAIGCMWPLPCLAC